MAIVPEFAHRRHRVTVEHLRYDGNTGDNTPHIDNVSLATE